MLTFPSGRVLTDISYQIAEVIYSMSLQNYPTASLIRRLAAMAYDALVLLALYIILGGILVTAISEMTGQEEMVRLSPAMVGSVFYTICFLYYMHSWRRGGQTIGMKAWNIYLITNDNSPVKLSHCILRSATGFFSLAIVGLGYFWMLIDKKERTWHDIASLTRIVYRPKGS